MNRPSSDAKVEGASGRGQCSLLAALAEALPWPVQVFDRDGRCVLTNHAFTSLFGAEQTVGSGEHSSVAPLARALAGEVVHVPVEVYELEGERRKVALSATVFPIRTQGSRVTHVGRAFTAVTTAEQVLAREPRGESRVSEVLLRLGAILSAEHDPAAIFGSVAEEATQLTRAKRGAFVHPSRSVAAACGEGAENIARFFDPAGTARRERPAVLSVPVFGRSGRLIGGLVMGHDDPHAFGSREERLLEGLARYAGIAIENARLYGEEQRARLEAEEASRLKDEFLATASHELKTPLNAILGWARLVRVARLSGDRLERAIATIERNALAQAQVIDDLLDVSSLLAGTITLTRRDVDVNRMVKECANAVAGAAARKEIDLTLELSPDAGRVSADLERLQQILWNLLSNAVKFTNRGGHVTVSTARDGDQVTIAVADDGRGIRPAFLPFVFDRFRQADSSPTREQGGLGLGLSIVRSLTELHGGRVEAHSPGEGRGATFTVRLPSA